ncbi:3'-5' exonuclease [Variovorax sp. LT1P1]|uniref:3'-5' exonuclease n=1 Tax=Variovorax sp. LT1P1 TaxID=3443730 RepID=UPI003F46235B
MDMMLTTSTLGREPGCIVMNIGAVMFDPSGREAAAARQAENQFYTPVSALDSGRLGLRTSDDTVHWWRQQPAWPTVGEEFMTSNVAVAEACERFAEFYRQHKPRKVWAKSPTFHSSILRHLFALSGIEYPVEDFRDEACFRTVMDLTYGQREQHPTPTNAQGYQSHQAVGRAIRQSDDLVAAVNRDRSAGPLVDLRNQRWLMLDIKTLGRTRGSGILSIGASMFNAANDSALLEQPSNQFYSVISSFDLANHGFATEPETLRFWNSQPIWPELAVATMNSPVMVKRACQDFADFLERMRPDKVWANSPTFDLELLRFTFRKMGVNLDIPYASECDFRTVMDWAYPQRDERPGRMLQSELKHHALGDSIEQALQTRLALNSLGLVVDNKPSPPTRGARKEATTNKRVKQARAAIDAADLALGESSSAPRKAGGRPS